MSLPAATDSPADDMLHSVREIADFLGWSQRKVYSVREAAADGPIRKQPGTGIYAFKSELLAWLRSPQGQPLPDDRSAA